MLRRLRLGGFKQHTSRSVVSQHGLAKRRSRLLRSPRIESLEQCAVLSFTVLNLADSGPGSLRDAIEAANLNPGADTINFARNVRGTITLTSGQLSISDDTTINGPGAKKLAVSGNDAQRVFFINDPNTSDAETPDVVISGLEITKGQATDRGGGVYSVASNLTLQKVKLTDNHVIQRDDNGGRGGGVRSDGGVLNLIDSEVSRNLATGNQAFGGGIYGRSSQITIDNCLIKDNLSRR